MKKYFYLLFYQTIFLGNGKLLCASNKGKKCCFANFGTLFFYCYFALFQIIILGILCTTAETQMCKSRLENLVESDFFYKLHKMFFAFCSAKIAIKFSEENP